MQSHGKLDRLYEAERVMLSEEQQVALSASNGFQRLPSIVWRERVAQWFYDVADHLAERRAVVFVAMNILDRYCSLLYSQGQEVDEKTYEVSSMTAIFLAIRIAGSGSVQVQSIVRMSQHGVRTQDIVATGTKMVRDLKLEQKVVGPSDFLGSFFALLHSASSHTIESANYLAELATCDVFFTQHKPSNVALAALLNAYSADLDTPGHNFLEVLRQSLRTDPEAQEITTLRRRLHGLYLSSIECMNEAPHVIADDSSPEDVARNGLRSTVAVRNISQEFADTEPSPRASLKRSLSTVEDLRSLKRVRSEVSIIP